MRSKVGGHEETDAVLFNNLKECLTIHAQLITFKILQIIVGYSPSVAFSNNNTNKKFK